MTIEFSRQLLKKYANIKFHENPSSGSQAVPCGRTDTTKLTAAFRIFANAPKTRQVQANRKGYSVHRPGFEFITSRNSAKYEAVSYRLKPSRSWAHCCPLRNHIYCDNLPCKWNNRIIIYEFISRPINIDILFVCSFSWRYNPLWLYFPQPGSGL
jgi:hypothetical protein